MHSPTFLTSEYIMIDDIFLVVSEHMGRSCRVCNVTSVLETEVPGYSYSKMVKTDSEELFASFSSYKSKRRL